MYAYIDKPYINTIFDRMSYPMAPLIVLIKSVCPSPFVVCFIYYQKNKIKKANLIIEIIQVVVCAYQFFFSLSSLVYETT